MFMNTLFIHVSGMSINQTLEDEIKKVEVEITKVEQDIARVRDKIELRETTLEGTSDEKTIEYLRSVILALLGNEAALRGEKAALRGKEAALLETSKKAGVSEFYSFGITIIVSVIISKRDIYPHLLRRDYTGLNVILILFRRICSWRFIKVVANEYCCIFLFTFSISHSILSLAC